MKKAIPAKRRNPFAQSLHAPQFRKRVVGMKKAYTRKGRIKNKVNRGSE